LIGLRLNSKDEIGRMKAESYFSSFISSLILAFLLALRCNAV
jgi:hypothetical protein